MRDFSGATHNACFFLEATFLQIEYKDLYKIDEDEEIITNSCFSSTT
jgi:hypothetical protein